ncbi:MAG: acyl-CoA desaturase [Acidobacteriota bacterium]
MAERRPFKFTEPVTTSGFSKTLSLRVDDYFQSRGIGRHANLEMITKTVLGLVLWIATYIWLLTGRFSPLQVVGVYVVHGLAQLHMAFNIAHDANHGAYSRSKRVNRILACVFDGVGASSYMWRLMHNDSHHSFVNVREADSTFASGNIFRFSPRDEIKPYHRYQHLYAPLIYCLTTLDWTLTKDFRWFFRERRFGNRKVIRHPLSEVILLFGGKAFYFTYMLVLPLLVLHVPWYAVVAGFVVMHLLLGFSLALIFQPNHFNEDATFPEANEEGHISNNYIRHIFDTTSDYARGNPFANWILGCLNLHVIHHMFPSICHVHYPALTRILKETADEYGLNYRENRTLSGAFLAHLRWLRVLGRGEERQGFGSIYGVNAK